MQLQDAFGQVHISPGGKEGLEPFRVEGIMNLGFGFTKNNTGLILENGDDVTISPGGGMGFGAVLGYTFWQHLDGSVGIAYQTSAMDKIITNAKGHFSRILLSPAVQYFFTLKFKNARLGFGAGASIAAGSSMNLDAHKVQGGAHNIYRYAVAVGPSGQCMYYYPFNQRVTFNFGCKIYQLKYRLNRVESDGKEIPVSKLPADILEDVEKLDGSGIDLVIGMSYHF